MDRADLVGSGAIAAMSGKESHSDQARLLLRANGWETLDS